MAIELEKKEDSTNWLPIISTIVIVAVLFVGGYFLFFQRPELIDVAAPGDFEKLKRLSNVEFSPQKLLESEKFKMLRQMETEASLPEPGKNNPFKP